jgi:hypothetical protein
VLLLDVADAEAHEEATAERARMEKRGVKSRARVRLRSSAWAPHEAVEIPASGARPLQRKTM